MSVLLPEKSRVLSLAVSPDGRAIAVVLVKEGKQQIWVRALDTLEPTPLAGTDDAADPFWSPDSRFIAFFSDARLKKIDRSWRSRRAGHRMDGSSFMRKSIREPGRTCSRFQ